MQQKRDAIKEWRLCIPGRVALKPAREDSYSLPFLKNHVLNVRVLVHNCSGILIMGLKLRSTSPIWAAAVRLKDIDSIDVVPTGSIIPSDMLTCDNAGAITSNIVWAAAVSLLSIMDW